MRAGRALPFTIRPYRPDDSRTLCRIDSICFPPGIAYSHVELLFYLKHPNSIARVAEREGTIVGFTVGRVHRGLGHVVTLDVLPGARRHGVGVALMAGLHEEFKKQEVRAAILEVSAEDRGAQAFYEKLGYKYADRIPDYYGDGADAWRMVYPF
jgi:[ribosomal protein S18]-alanine N-acetyltransferase